MRDVVKCRVCEGLLGELGAGERTHRFCEWATPADWEAILPWVSGMRQGVTMGGA